jgi:hypothetical protein
VPLKLGRPLATGEKSDPPLGAALSPPALGVLGALGAPAVLGDPAVLGTPEGGPGRCSAGCPLAGSLDAGGPFPTWRMFNLLVTFSVLLKSRINYHCEHTKNRARHP